MMLRLGPALWLLQLSCLVFTTHSRVSLASCRLVIRLIDLSLSLNRPRYSLV